MEELIKRTESILTKFPNGRPQGSEAAEMFALHNEIFPNLREHGIGCGGCRQRVYDRLKKWYTENKVS
jgi:hypothetical protein